MVLQIYLSHILFYSQAEKAFFSLPISRLIVSYKSNNHKKWHASILESTWDHCETGGARFRTLDEILSLSYRLPKEILPQTYKK